MHRESGRGREPYEMGRRRADGSGMPAYQGDVGVRNGRIAEICRLNGSVRHTIDASGKVVAPGFIDNHCHFDAQATWDPLCSHSPHHGALSTRHEAQPLPPHACKHVSWNNT